MDKKTSGARRTDALTRERIVEAGIELLDSGGEAGLTFRSLSVRLATGPGAIYGHIANRDDLLAAACDAVFARSVDPAPDGGTPAESVRALALAMFDTIDAHPWTSAALGWSGGQLTLARVLERLGRQICALGVPEQRRWAAVSALLNYILGVGGQNASNAQQGRQRGADRSATLGAIEHSWMQLDAAAYPFVRSVAAQMHEHDDRADFLVGIDLILEGLAALK